MATMLPELDDHSLGRLPPKRAAEVAVYRALRDQLPAEVVVLYSVATLVRRHTIHEGEADFVVLYPNLGMMVIEVKGGGIRYSSRADSWQSVDRHGVAHDIKDPFQQAQARKHDLIHLLKGHPAWRQSVRHHVIAAHGAIFPHLDRSALAALRLPQASAEIVGSREDLNNPQRWMERACQHCAKPRDRPLNSMDVKLAREILRSDVEIELPRAIRMEWQEEDRVRLTREQAVFLEIIADRDQVAISGGAGTGKSMLALIEALRVAKGGKTPLLLCVNQLLCRSLADACEGSTVQAMTLHQLYEWWVSVASKDQGRNLLAEAEAQYPGESREQVVLPQAFSIALEITDPPPWDTLILDEGQDLGDSDWLAIDLLRERTQARLVVFHDHNQALYQRASCFPITDAKDRFPLTRNCRNTTPIYESAYRFYEGPTTMPPPIPGEAPVLVHAGNPGAQARAIRDQVQRLLGEGVRAEEIAVLLVDRDASKSESFRILPPLAPEGQASWGLSQYQKPGKVIFESVGRFKGLEASVVLLWIGAGLDATVHREWIYVGMSRAKSSLYLVGTAAACREAMEGLVRARSRV